MELSALIILIQLYWIPAVIVAYIIASFLVVLSVYHGQSPSLFLYRFLHPRTSLAILLLQCACISSFSGSELDLLQMQFNALRCRHSWGP